MTAVAIVLAVLGAGGFAVAARMQHSAVRTAVGPRPLRFTAAARLVRQPGWLGGLLLLAGGAALHATALVLAPIAVVQPLGVLALPISVVLAARAAHLPLDRAVVAGAASSAVGVAAFVALAASSAVAEPLAPYTELRIGLLVAAVVLGLGGLRLRVHSRVRCLAFGSAAGVSFGFVSVVLRALSQRVRAGEVSGLDDPLVIATALAILAGLVVGGCFVQLAYSAGPPALVIGSLTVVDPLVAVGLGIGLLGEGDRTTWLTGTAELACAAAAVLGVLALARYHPEPTPSSLRGELTKIGEPV